MHAREACEGWRKQTREVCVGWRKQTALAPRAGHLCKLQGTERSPAELMETPLARGRQRQAYTAHTHTVSGEGGLIQKGAEEY